MSTAGDGILQRLELVFTLVVRDLRVRYRRSTLGLLWSMLLPCLNMLIFTNTALGTGSFLRMLALRARLFIALITLC